MKETHNYIHYIQSGVNLKSDNEAVGRTQHKQRLGGRRNKRVTQKKVRSLFYRMEQCKMLVFRMLIHVLSST